jgi:hypothetical protein
MCIVLNTVALDLSGGRPLTAEKMHGYNEMYLCIYLNAPLMVVLIEKAASVMVHNDRNQICCT